MEQEIHLKIAIVGSRKFDDYDALDKFIRENVEFEDIELVISGGAQGADNLGSLFAYKNDIEKKIFPAEWNKYGPRAGFLRNVDIIDNADVVFAFWDSKSKGTQHSINLAKKKDKILHTYLIPDIPVY